MTQKRVAIVDSTLRDGQETLLGGRLRTELVSPHLEALDSVGFHALELWGGGTFQASLALLHEDPWERLRILRRQVKKSPIQALIRGRFLVAERPFSYGFIKRFLKRVAELGVDIVRIFDPLNNLASLSRVARLAHQMGLRVQISLLFPYFVTPEYLKFVRQSDLVDSEAVGIFDPVGTLRPWLAGELVGLLTEVYAREVFVHVHDLDGAGIATLTRACESGASIVDACFSAFTKRGSLPSIETLVVCLGGERDSSGLKVREMLDAGRRFWSLRSEYFDKVPQVMQPSTSQEKMISQMMPTSAFHTLPPTTRNRLMREGRIRVETARIIKELGSVTLVSPLTQIIGTQAILNLRLRKRYVQISDEFLRLLRGEFGPVRIPSSLIRYLGKSISHDKQTEEHEEELVAPHHAALSSEEDYLGFELFPLAWEVLQIARKKKLHEQRHGIVGATIALRTEEKLKMEPSKRGPTLLAAPQGVVGWKRTRVVEEPFYSTTPGFLEEPF